MANTGILYRRNVKSFFEKDNNKPIEGEIVYATDTHEYGALDEDGSIVWRQHEGSVISINGRQGEIHLDKVDVGLSNVDNTSDNDKPLSSAIKKELKEHYEATNPHHVTPQQIGLGNVENTSDIDKPISRLTQSALDLKLDKSAIPANAKFTDTTYEIKDGELSEYNFNKSYKDKLDYLSTNRQLLSAGNALRAQGRNIILTRADGSTETIETQDTIYDDTNVLQTLSNILTKFDALNIKDNLNSENGVLSAKQGKILNDKITEIKEMLKSDNVDLDSLQEIVTFIENNKHLIDSLEIDNIANLRNVLNSKCDFVNEQGTVRNALNFDNHEISDFVMKRDYLNYKNNIDNSIATINTKFSLYYTKSETDSKIQLAVDSIDYSDINKKIDNNFNALNDKISAIDYTYIATDLQNAKTQLEAKDLEIQTDLTNKYSELKTTINSINFAQINSNIANLNKLIKDNSLGDLNTNVTNNKAKIDEILNNLQLYLKKSEFTDEINKEYAQNIEPKINEKISRLVTQNDLLNKTTELNTLITKLQEKLNSTNSDLNDVEDDISNIYHLLHNVKVDLSSYYTKAEVDAKVAAGGTFDASQYYNKSQVDAKIPNVDLTNYYKKNEVYNKSEVDSKVASAGNFNAALYYPKTETYSKSEVDTKVGAIPTFNASQYYNKSEVDDKFETKEDTETAIDDLRQTLQSKIIENIESERIYHYTKGEIESKLTEVKTLFTEYYPQTETYNKHEIDEKVNAIPTFNSSQYYNKSEIDTKVNFAHQNAIAVTNETMLDNIKLVKKSIAECAKKESIYNKNQIDSKLNNYLNKDFSIYKLKLPQKFISSLKFQYASPSAEYTTEIPQKFNGINLKEREYIFLDADIFYFGTQGVTVNNKSFNAPDLSHSSGYNFKIKKTELKDNNFYTYLYMILISNDGQDKKAFKFTLKQSFSFVGENVNITMTLIAPKVSSKVYNDFVLNEENIDENTFTEFETSESFEIGTPYENYVNLLVNLKDINEIKELKEEISFGEIGISQEINVPNLKSLKNELTINIPLNTKISDREYSLEDTLNFIDLEKHFDLRLLNYTGSLAFESKFTLERIEDKGNFLNFYINTTRYDQVTIYRIPIEKTATKKNNNLKITIKIEYVLYKNKYSFNKLYTNLIDFDENYEIDTDLDDIKVFFDGSLRCNMLYFFTRKEVIIDEILKRKSTGNVDLSKNISSTIRTNIHDGAGILLPSENWKSVQNFQTVSDAPQFQIFVVYENPKSGILVNDEKRCVSGVILIDVRHDNGLEITTLSGQEIIKVNEFDKTSFKRGINIIYYFCVEKTIYITKVK